MKRPLAALLVVSISSAYLLSFGYASASSMSEAVLAKFKELETHYQLPSGVLAKIAKLESGGNAQAINGPTQAGGLFQWIPKYWVGASQSLYGQPRNVTDRFNPFISAEVTAFTLAQAKSRNGPIVQQAGVDMSVGLYMSHFLGQGGANKFFSAFIQNPTANAAQIFPLEAKYNPQIFSKGSGRLVDIVNYMAQRMSVPGITNVTGYDGNYDGPPNGRIMDSTGSQLLAKPFNGSVPSSPATRTFEDTYSQSPSTPSDPVQQTGPAASLLLVQPLSVYAGDTILVSWASVGMRTDTFCRVTTGSEVLGESNEGTVRYLVPSGSTGGISFKLNCTPGSGLPHEKIATVSIR